LLFFPASEPTTNELGRNLPSRTQSPLRDERETIPVFYPEKREIGYHFPRDTKILSTGKPSSASCAWKKKYLGAKPPRASQKRWSELQRRRPTALHKRSGLFVSSPGARKRRTGLCLEGGSSVGAPGRERKGGPRPASRRTRLTSLHCLAE